MPTNTKLVWNNSSPHWEEKPIWGGGGAPPPPPLLAIRGLRSVSFQILSTSFISAINLNLHKKNVKPAKLLNFTRNKRCVHSFWFHFSFEVVWGRVKTTFCRPIQVKRRQSQPLTPEEPNDNYHKLCFCKFQVVSGESLMNENVYQWLTGPGP